jgi:hypothetical protein
MTDIITFGPEGQEWIYSKSSRTYDLSGGSARRLTLSTTEGPEDTWITIDPSSSALVVIDMQNFFLDTKCIDHPHSLKAVNPTITVIERYRQASIQVI